MALFNGSTEQFRTLVPGITVNFSLEAAMPELQAAEATILPRFLGTAIAAQLATLGSEQGQLSDTLSRALFLAQVAVGRIGFANYLPFAEVQIGDDGVTISNQEGRKAAFEYQTNRLHRRLLDEGWRSMDELIALVAGNSVLFPAWPDSPYYAEHQAAIFKDPASFSKYYPIQNRWLTYWSLRPFMQAVEETRGDDGQARIDALPDSVTDDQRKRVQRDLLRALAYQTVMDALPNLSVELNGANVQVNYASQFGNAEYYEPPGKDHLSWVMQNLQKQLDLAWSTFETDISGLETPSPTPDTGAGLIYSTGAVTFL